MSPLHQNFSVSSLLTLFFPFWTFNFVLRCQQWCDNLMWTVRGLNHPYTCIHFPPKPPPIQAAREHWAEFPVLYSGSLLVIPLLTFWSRHLLLWGCFVPGRIFTSILSLPARWQDPPPVVTAKNVCMHLQFRTTALVLILVCKFTLFLLSQAFGYVWDDIKECKIIFSPFHVF